MMNGRILEALCVAPSFVSVVVDCDIECTVHHKY